MEKFYTVTVSVDDDSVWPDGSHGLVRSLSRRSEEDAQNLLAELIWRKIAPLGIGVISAKQEQSPQREIDANISE